MKLNLSVMLFPFHRAVSEGTLAPAQLTQAIIGAGIGAIEPMLSNLDLAPKPWQKIMELCQEAGLQISCLDIGTNLIGSPEELDRAFATVERGLDLCVQWRCPIALIAGTRPSEGLSNEDGRMIYARGLAKCATMAMERGIIPTIEDFGVYPEFACRSDHVQEVVTMAGPEVKVTWDNGNFILADEEPMHAYKVLRDMTVHAHIKDFALDESGQASLKTPSGKAYKGVWIGQGDCQVAECVQAFKRDGYEGWLSLEINSPQIEEMQSGADFVKKAWEEA